MMVINTIAVAFGGFFGAITRYSISQWMKKRKPTSFPLATFIINLMGSFLLGFIYGTETGGLPLLLLGTGFMGAFTTFSTFKLENIQLIVNKKWNTQVIYLVFSYLLGISLAFLGVIIGKM
ncbi:putative fluoride ion transporter CrcB 2 [Heyndrickxia oleronia]|nr:putative fluoride ion transporter CrcB 2 [Heyndrickxia oleronia]